ncbi:MAG TPA: pantoate--beta-alanine ligase [Bacteroidales bacterium]|nr:pantoate--beta-alanine ligase [Bacteroidales bacterium]
MIIVKDPVELNNALSELREYSRSTGFVPTMGALHAGHLSLIKHARNENPICVVSVFVNPTQFNDSEDLKKYPRTPEKDLEMIEREGVDVVFMPDAEDIYPDNDRNTFDLGGLDNIMEGKFRPGHFDGVADVVYRLFNMVKPDRAYFGEKDYQQLMIIRQMVKSENLDVDIVGVPIVREADGLAMSSRNQRLSENGRQQAATIYKILRQASETFPDLSPDELKAEIVQRINTTELLNSEYVEIVDEEKMQIVDDWNQGSVFRLCLAVWCDNVRLIDNISLVK